MKSKTVGNVLLLFTAVIWGSAFVAQSTGMEYVDPFTFNMSRSFVGFLVLIPVVIFFRKENSKKTPLSKEARVLLNKESFIGGIFCGIALGVASSVQQVGISMTTAGKAGFITALYIIIVPILGVILKKKIPKIIWLCVVIALVGFYLLCINDDFTLSTGDLLCLICAFCFSCHIMVIDYFTSKNVDCIMMSCIQFFFAGVISLILMFIFETPSLISIWNARDSILYAGVLSSGIAYTLQIIAQKKTDPVIAPLIMSLESVFAALSGWIVLNEVLSGKELAGCALVFAAVILSQIPFPQKAKSPK